MARIKWIDSFWGLILLLTACRIAVSPQADVREASILGSSSIHSAWMNLLPQQVSAEVVGLQDRLKVHDSFGLGEEGSNAAGTVMIFLEGPSWANGSGWGNLSAKALSEIASPLGLRLGRDAELGEQKRDEGTKQSTCFSSIAPDLGAGCPAFSD